MGVKANSKITTPKAARNQTNTLVKKIEHRPGGVSPVLLIL
ncbi:hypothetical protein JOC34_003280 [Virgibacillus halotolerans]|nr:hypothetical protein [Virgibacillus halotolerans]